MIDRVVQPSFLTSSYLTIGKILSKTAEAIKTIATPVFLILGAMYLALHYASPLNILVATQIVPFNVIGFGFLALGSFLYLKGLWDQSKRESAIESNLNAKLQAVIENIEHDRLVQSLDLKEYRESLDKNQKLEAKIATLKQENRELKSIGRELQSRFLPIEETINENIYYTNNVIMGGASVKIVKEAFSPTHGFVALSYNDKNKFFPTIDAINAWNDSQIDSQILDFEDRGNVQVSTQQWYNAGTLSSQLDKDDLDDGQWIQLIDQLLESYKSLHKKRLIHGDPKPANIMFNYDSDDECYNLHLIDLDLLQFQEEKKDTLGALIYRAPELIWNEKQLIELRRVDRAKAEVWAIGLMICSMLTGKLGIVQDLMNEVETMQDGVLLRNHLRKKIEKEKGIDLKKIEISHLCDLFETWKEEIKLPAKFENYRPLIDAMLKTQPEARCTMDEACFLFDQVSDSD